MCEDIVDKVQKWKHVDWGEEELALLSKRRRTNVTAVVHFTSSQLSLFRSRSFWTWLKLVVQTLQFVVAPREESVEFFNSVVVLHMVTY